MHHPGASNARSGLSCLEKISRSALLIELSKKGLRAEREKVWIALGAV
jgi:hypothetical protein